MKTTGNGKTKRNRLLVPVLSAVVFLLLSFAGITRIGLYYDELHQATASFAWKGMNPDMFNFSFRGTPLMNLPYTGAIKSNLYGLYLFLFNRDFSVVSWRMTGILAVTLALLFFGIVAGKKVPRRALILFYLLFLTDASILYMTRFDWGPVALALSFRILFIAAWIRGELREEGPSKFNSLALGFIAGISLYEKLSSVVLFAPLLLFFLGSRRRRNISHAGYGLLGVLTGAFPLVAINLYTLCIRHSLLSVTAVQAAEVHRYVSGPLHYFLQYLGLGAGCQVAGIVSNTRVGMDHMRPEIAGMALLLGTGLVLMAKRGLGNGYRALFFMAGGSYLLAGALIYLLPATTWVHHWIIGTPFQYAALMMVVPLIRKGASPPVRGFRLPVAILFSATLILFLAFRVFSVFQVEKRLTSGPVSARWSPDFTRLGEFASRQPKDVLFVAADWGLATQVYCLGNGRVSVCEAFWPVRDSLDLRMHYLDAIREKRPGTIYLLFMVPPTNIFPEQTALALPVMRSLPGWRERPTGKDLAFTNIRVFRFVSEADLPGKNPQ